MNDAKNLLKWYVEMGVDSFLSEKPINRLKKDEEKFELKVKTPEYNASREIADKCNNLGMLEQAVKAFDGCAIKKGATNTVFKDGNPKSKIMLIGEAPGANEDEQGIPFCGLSGKLLNNILLAIGLKREDVYISNTVFWRPPGNRRPTTEEIKICRPFVEKHVALVAPKLIILVGNTAVESLLDLKVSMASLRGKYFDYSNPYLSKPIKTAVIFHPAYLLRQALKKKEMWMDILKIKKEFLS
ncbi:uracil-DNA glycosylase [Holosporaceae bacterium 'Namur']|nr:uracil-DNA glycosylase [Holosporaceae bacterium 'Namur']